MENNYLGLESHAELIARSVREGIDSVRVKHKLEPEYSYLFLISLITITTMTEPSGYTVKNIIS
jgi:hypothetical protein